MYSMIKVNCQSGTVENQNSSFTYRAFKCFRWCWRNNSWYFPELKHFNFLCIKCEFCIGINFLNDSKLLPRIDQGFILWFGYWWIGWDRIDFWTLRRFTSFLSLIPCIKRVPDSHILQFSRIYVSHDFRSLTRAWVINQKQRLFPWIIIHTISKYTMEFEL